MVAVWILVGLVVVAMLVELVRDIS